MNNRVVEKSDYEYLSDWDRYFIRMCITVASKSKDPSTKVGSVVVDQQNTLVSAGYNGFPRRIADTDARLNSREEKYPRVIHAELNALLFSKRDITGCTLYASAIPCDVCSLPIIQCGISRIVAIHNADYETRWRDMIMRSLANFNEAGIEVIVVTGIDSDMKLLNQQ